MESNAKKKIAKNAPIIEHDRRNWTVSVNIDLCLLALLLFGFLTRFPYLEHPRNIVFDEIHFGKYVALYTKRVFFFDFNPPLGKQLLALVAYVSGFNMDFEFDKIGTPYPSVMPVFMLRALPAFCGSLLPASAYTLALEHRMQQPFAFLLGIVLVCENALLTQSRFVLMEPILLLFITLALIACRRFCRQSGTGSAFVWLALATLFTTCAICIKYFAIFCTFLIVIQVIRNLWHQIPDRKTTVVQLLGRCLVQAVIAIGIFTTVYLLVFYVHLTVLTKSGHHDSIMSSAFQASLDGGLASITKGQPLMIAHGSQITLRHSYGRTCWLHSHQNVYPVRYADNRGSSHQQQVTCYSFKDVNNWWIVKRPEKNSLIVDDQLDVIKDGDVVQLVHGMSGRALNSHDVAAPMSPNMQEVSCYIDYNISMAAQNLWQVRIINGPAAAVAAATTTTTATTKWHAIGSLVRLVHVNSSQALKFSGKQLPDWGYHQHEIVTDKLIEQDDTIWNVEEHRYSKNGNDKDREQQLLNAEMIPTSQTDLTFWQKFAELQYKMISASVSSQSIDSHMYSSEPFEWPFLTRGVAYWISDKSNAQVYLIGNIVIWYTATFAFLTYAITLVVHVIRRRRHLYDLSVRDWTKLEDVTFVFVFGYLLNYVPFYFVERTLFLHHYLIAYYFKLFVLVFCIEYWWQQVRTDCKWRRVAAAAIAAWLTAVVYVFWKFSVLAYGWRDLNAHEIRDLEWKSDWTLISH